MRWRFWRRHRVLWAEQLRKDVAYAVRSLGRAPIVVITIVLTLVLGLGMNAVMFSLLDVLYLRPAAGVANPGGVHRLWEQRVFESGTQYWPGFDYPTYRAVHEAVAGSAATATYAWPQKLPLARGERAPTAMVSHALWRIRMHGASDVLGTRLNLGKNGVTIIGVAPPGFTGVDLDAVDI